MREHDIAAMREMRIKLYPRQRSAQQTGEVRFVQELLKDFATPAYDPGPVDSDFGPLTEAAVKNFQGDFLDFDGHPLKKDGIVGEKTWTALWS